jgi:hypothetical protein
MAAGSLECLSRSEEGDSRLAVGDSRLADPRIQRFRDSRIQD